jgi:hypothetical protein
MIDNAKERKEPLGESMVRTISWRQPKQATAAAGSTFQGQIPREAGGQRNMFL